MKRNIKFLLGVTALAGAYWLWKNNKSESNEPREIGKKYYSLKGDNVTKKGSEGVASMPLSQAATKEECQSLGGWWFPEAVCVRQPCPKCFPKTEFSQDIV